MTWNYRIVHRLDGSFGLHEVYYDAEGRPNGMTENPAGFVADRHEGSVAIQEALLTASVDARKRGVFVEPAEGEWPGDAP